MSSATAMHLSDSAEHGEFRRAAREWLVAHAPRGPLEPAHTEAGFAQRRSWERQLFEAGWAAVHWPTAHGGRGADVVASAIFAEEYHRSGAPERINGLGLNLLGPTLLEFGTPEQQERWLAPILRCDEIWCQGFSEPDAGSDLASLRTTAVADGDQFVVNGQKIWTSLGKFGDWIFALVRTDPNVAKHRGITMLAIDMSTPGVDVRPLRQIDGAPSFAEVFFSDVLVPRAHVIGDVDDGWRLAMRALGYERGSAFGAHVGFSADVRNLAAIVEVGDPDPVLDDRVAELFVRSEVYRALSAKMLTRVADGTAADPEASLAKLYWSEMEVGIFDAGLSALGPLAELEADSTLIGATLSGRARVAFDDWHHRYWYARAATIFAGTSEVQRNIIAERLLGLPREGA